MGRRSLRPGRARLPVGLLGMIALVAIAEAAMVRHDWGFRDPKGLLWRYRDRVARREAPGARVLCFGDSLLKYGIVPDVIEAGTGLRTCNLAITGGPPPASLFLLRHALDSGARPRAVLVDFIPHLLDRSPTACEGVLPEIADLRECLDLARSTRESELFARLVLGRLLPSYRDRHGVRDRAAAILGRRADPVREEPDRATREAALYDPLIYPDIWNCSDVNASYVRRFLDLADAHGIAVFWLLPPFRSDALAHRGRLGLEASYTRFVRSIGDQYPTLTVIDGRSRGGDPSTHLDPIHLSPPGASSFSADVAAIVARRLAGSSPCPRWVELAPASSGVAFAPR